MEHQNADVNRCSLALWQDPNIKPGAGEMCPTGVAFT
jgi:hypothetical protein